MDLGLALLCSCSVTLGKAPNLSESLSWGGDDVHRAGHVVTDSTSGALVTFGAGRVRADTSRLESLKAAALPLVVVVVAPAKERIPRGPRFRRPGSSQGGYSILTVTLLWKKIFLTSLSASSFVTCKGCPSYGYSEH